MVCSRASVVITLMLDNALAVRDPDFTYPTDSGVNPSFLHCLI